VEAATDAGVLVCNTQTPANASSMAEATITLMMAAIKRLRLRSRRAWDLTWRDDGTEQAVLLYGATVGIVGLGAIGKSVARHLFGWNVRLLGFTRTPDPAVATEFGVELVDLPTLLAESDVVTLHVPLTDGTRGLIGEAELRTMKPTAYLINTARGAIVDTSAIPAAIASGQLAGAAIDVLATEPPSDNDPLLTAWRDPAHPAHHRVIVNPHAAFYSEEGLRDMRVKGAAACRRAILGEPVRTVIN